MGTTHKKLMARLIQKKAKAGPMSLRQFYEKRDKVLILRSNGGLGDILVHRMMFEDFKRIHPGCHLTFACPQIYHEAVRDHPYLDEVLDCEKVDASAYLASYNTTSACCRHEIKMSPFSGKNRSDVWANHCGVELQHHNMHINLESAIKDQSKRTVEAHRDRQGPSILVSPISAMVGKNLRGSQLEGVINGLRDRGFYVYATHTTPIPECTNLRVPVMSGNIRQWMGYVYAADYVLSVDTATFHFAGGIGKPLTGIYTFCDGKVYGKYYDFILVQKHRDDGNWDCGPCYNWPDCPKTKHHLKPCLTELTPKMILDGVDKMIAKWP